MIAIANHRLILFALSEVVLGASCSFLTPRADPTRYYLLTATAAPSPPPRETPLVGLGPITLPSYLMRPELVSRKGANQIEVSDYDRWAEPLEDGFARALRQDLMASLGTDRVARFPFAPSAAPALVVSVEVRRFERAGDDVELSAHFSVRQSQGDVLLESRDFEARRPIDGARTAAAGGGMSNAVAALSEALAALGRDIAEAVKKPH